MKAAPKGALKVVWMAQRLVDLLVYLMAGLKAVHLAVLSAFGSVAQMVARREKEMAKNSARLSDAKSLIQKLGQVAGKLLPILL